jgi:hypothetical protein
MIEEHLHSKAKAEIEATQLRKQAKSQRIATNKTMSNTKTNRKLTIV